MFCGFSLFTQKFNQFGLSIVSRSKKLFGVNFIYILINQGPSKSSKMHVKNKIFFELFTKQKIELKIVTFLAAQSLGTIHLRRRQIFHDF